MVMGLTLKKCMHTFLGLIFVLFITSCESKVMEKKADSYNDPISTDVKIKVQNDFENKLLRVQEYIRNVQKFISNIQTLLKTNGPITPLSFFDIMGQINESALNQLPEISDNNIEYAGQFEINTDLLPENCKVFSFLISADSKSEISEMTYKLKSCQTNGQFLELIKVIFDKKTVQVKVNQENLGLILPPSVFQNQIPTCQFSKNQKQTNKCENIVFAHAIDLIWTTNIALGEKIRVEVKGISKKSGAVVYKGQVVLTQAGKIESSDIQGPLVNEN